MSRCVVVGDLLIDRDIAGVVDRLCPDAPVPVFTEMSAVERLGGAGLAAGFLVLDGFDVTVVGAGASGERGGGRRDGHRRRDHDGRQRGGQHGSSSHCGLLRRVLRGLQGQANVTAPTGHDIRPFGWLSPPFTSNSFDVSWEHGRPGVRADGRSSAQVAAADRAGRQ